MAAVAGSPNPLLFGERDMVAPRPLPREGSAELKAAERRTRLVKKRIEEVSESCRCGASHAIGALDHGELVSCECGLDWVVVVHDGRHLEPFDELEAWDGSG